MGSSESFRRRTRLTEAQYEILRSMENGEVVRRKVASYAQSLRSLVDNGVLEYVEMKTGRYTDDVYRITALGREVLAAAHHC